MKPSRTLLATPLLLLLACPHLMVLGRNPRPTSTSTAGRCAGRVF